MPENLPTYFEEPQQSREDVSFTIFDTLIQGNVIVVVGPLGAVRIPGARLTFDYTITHGTFANRRAGTFHFVP